MKPKRQHPYRNLSPSALQMVAVRFRILGEPMRLSILQRLMGGEKNVTDLVKLLNTTQANVSKHLSLLLQHQMVSKRREGNNIYYSIADPTIFELCNTVCSGLQKEYNQRAKLISM